MDIATSGKELKCVNDVNGRWGEVKLSVVSGHGLRGQETLHM